MHAETIFKFDQQGDKTSSIKDNDETREFFDTTLTSVRYEGINQTTSAIFSSSEEER